MNRILIALQLCFTLLFAGMFTNCYPRNPRIGFSNSACLFSLPCDTIPELNQKIIDLVKKQIGLTVGRGECWDLAALVLNTTGANWDKQYGYGRQVDPDKECVYPGDIIQFEGVKIKYIKGLTVFEETMGHHTAVINEVVSQGVFVLAHQNTGTSGRKVGLSNLDLKTIIAGKYQIYRPVQEALGDRQ